MVIITNYRLDEQGGRFLVIVKETSNCPICEKMLHGRSRRRRTLKCIDDKTITLIIRRMYCKTCEKIHHELPDCVVPYKRHSAETIEDVINDGTVAPVCDRSRNRIKRWWAIVLTYFLKILQTLIEKHGALWGEAPAFTEIVRAVVNSGNWIFADLICTRSAMLSG